MHSMSSPCVPRRPTKSHFQVSCLRFPVVCIGLGAMVTVSFLVYVSMVMSPTLVNYIVPEARLCKEMHNYLKDLLKGENSLPKYQHLQDQEQEPVFMNGMPTFEAVSKRLMGKFPGGRDVAEEVESSQLHSPGLLRILIGIITMAKKTDRRHLLRMAYRAQLSAIAHVEVKFVIGKMHDEYERTLVGLENLVYHDILELDCDENMNHGKTFTFFSTVAGIAAAKHTEHIHFYHYVMKTDDDSYVRIDNLARHLLPLPRSDLYYGYVIPCENQDPYQWYMAGMGYVISWDLVEWIRDSPIVANNTHGTEDELVGKWFDQGGKAKNRVNDKPLFYDHPAFGGKCAHELIPETILIHQVKNIERWTHVLSFFENDRLNLSLQVGRLGLT